MLPSLGQLSLRPEAMPAPTGEFYELSEPEANALNANGGKEPLTLANYRPHLKRGEEGATFRLFWDQKRVLRKNPPGHRNKEEAAAAAAGGRSRYAVYDAKGLWEWVKTHEKDPTNSFQISREDWMELYAEYGNSGPIPEFVSRLPSFEWPDFGPDTVWVYEESGVGKIRSNEPWTGGRWTATVDGAVRFDSYINFAENSQEPDFLPTDGFYYSGPPGEERIIEARRGRATDFFTGPPGREQIYEAITPKGTTRFYATDEEPRASRHRAGPEYFLERARGRLQKIVSADGLQVWHYTGPKKHERLVYSEVDRTNDANNFAWTERHHFTGRKGLERAYKMERVWRGDVIDTHYLRGAKEKEYAYKRVNKGAGWVAYYETGEEQKEALRRVEKVSDLRGEGVPDPSNPFAVRPYTRTMIHYFEGPRGAETFVRSEVTFTGPDGHVTSTETVLPEENPDRQERAQRIYDLWRRIHSAFASLILLVDSGQVEFDDPMDEDLE